MSAPDAKKMKLDEETNGNHNQSVDHDPATQAAIEQIDQIQQDVDRLNHQASEEILKVEQKFNKLRNPYFQKREVQTGKIPKFWAWVLLNHPQFSCLLSEVDEKIFLDHLTKLSVEDVEKEATGFSINFHFSENEWFSNEVLSKTFAMGEDGEQVYTGTEIKWKEGKELTRKPEDPNCEDAVAKYPSFFEWFTAEEADNPMLAADEFGEIIKEDIWANPLQYFLMTSDEEEDEDEEEIDEEDLEGEDEDEDEDAE